jgi:hypothetical protein
VPADHQEMHIGACHLTLHTPETAENFNFSHRNQSQQGASETQLSKIPPNLPKHIQYVQLYLKSTM